MTCPARYIIGANIFFLVCVLDRHHSGNHWDEAVEVEWMSKDHSYDRRVDGR